MSYFVFGTVRFVGAAAPVQERLRDAGQSAGIHVLLGTEIPQEIIFEMLGRRPEPGSLAFMLTAAPGDDTSHDLVSPFARGGIDGALAGIKKVAEWVQVVRANNDVSSMRVWMTEGYENAFTDVVCAPRDFERVIGAHVQRTADIPSLRIAVLAVAGE
jgi:hypothetical protein